MCAQKKKTKLVTLHNQLNVCAVRAVSIGNDTSEQRRVESIGLVDLEIGHEPADSGRGQCLLLDRVTLLLVVGSAARARSLNPLHVAIPFGLQLGITFRATL